MNPLKGVLSLMVASGLGWAQPVPVAILEFAILDESGKLISREEVKSADLARLSFLMPRSLAALLQRSGRYSVVLAEPGEGDLRTQAAALIGAKQAEQVIVGSLAPVGRSLVVSLERYIRQGEVMLRVANTVVNAPSPDEVPGLAARLLSEVYPAEAGLIPQQLALVFLEPNGLRLPVGQSAQLRTLALDPNGQPIQGARYVYVSSNPAAVLVDEAGTISAISPGQANITVQVVGVPRQGNLSASSTIHVITPFFGLRTGAVLQPRGAELSPQFRAGLTLTPQVSVRPPDVSKTTAASDDLFALIGRFFESLLATSPLTLEVDFSPDQLAIALETLLYTGNRSLGIGLVYAPALNQQSNTGFGLRVLFGTQFNLTRGSSLPLNLVADILFNPGSTSIRFGLQTGLNFFQ
jgi:hypothetical protein